MSHGKDPREVFNSMSGADLLVNSGVYQLVVPDSATKLDARGLPAFIPPDRELEQSEYEELLSVSAFSRVGPSEDELAMELYGSQHEVKVDPVAGYYLATYVGHVVDDQDRASSSSGGLTTWILQELLKSQRVDGVIHLRTGGSGGLFSYGISRTSAEISAGAKTRYYPASLSNALTEILQSAGRYAIVGIPSVLYEVRLACHRDPSLKARLPYFVGLVCGHQKSAHYAQSLAWQCGVAPGRIENIDFRVKLDAQPASAYGTEVQGVGQSGEQIRTVVETSRLYGTDWGLGYFKANFSDFSDDVFNETADVVLGDAWLPEYVQDPRGHNVVIVRSQEIAELFQLGVQRGSISVHAVPVADVLKSQAGLVRHGRTAIHDRTKYLAGRGEWVPELRPGVPRSTQSLGRRVIQQLRVELARESHSAFNKAVASGDFEVFVRSMAPVRRKYQAAYRAASFVARVKRGLSSLNGK
ncbi:Coenzyme F420 hydrogenase/dehydrogenase, beta subunit C-terminal domain [Microbacterium aquimaris]|uniref:Coenzyme F420 hydrogenase/dehydrogenase, beta subunit C-terminal domain n=1 Tax=Microbacterium aquimaris TaxID=459816 RepID=UPI002AD312CA|nr:Coenzyme F420 hydrogenase/dehydrogenase, beta subunit C-terminal domain [Microbacterium aquimaris]MDZ8274821.1 Coenzyme F420 hydrogenase/dehydrogenase, beta subunit C-terminal domain [Microbacterium aquimaris]